MPQRWQGTSSGVPMWREEDSQVAQMPLRDSVNVPHLRQVGMARKLRWGHIFLFFLPLEMLSHLEHLLFRRRRKKISYKRRECD
jgi:hypothetical protein